VCTHAQTIFFRTILIVKTALAAMFDIIIKIYFTPHVLFIATMAMFVEQWEHQTQL
jgi:hypothetical protein